MSEYERSITIQASKKQIEDFVSNIDNLPKYLPTTKKAMPEQGERVRVQGETPQGQPYNADGYFHMDKNANRMEWGSDGEEKYRGWLTFQGADENAPSLVTVHLSFDPSANMSKGLEKQANTADQAIDQGLENALLSMKNILERGEGKIQSSPS